ncbi:TetR/AcrR family transcriptional regulator [Stakelama saccharophila]|uniref:TetR/AcrR family transcriptional regulator n=1 Tax=Stakelama saccharophila TaxID=3075605 RepID=A0ABZ0B994_9SPHN|nr:TetR/AcrR family transcriptional regulator [Stakelama sp. W311]WNO53865.1 TetR/AcrR family transcriptional regulator [Stakelama sp. W311]
MPSPPYREPRQERSRRTFEALLDAAGVLLGEVGIERISTNLICERANVTPPAFYRYFDDKYAIVQALAERMMGRQNAAFEAWAKRYRDCGLEVLSDKILELMQAMAVITGGQPGAMWIMRALRAVPSLAPLRLYSHNYVADALTDIYLRYLPQVPRPLLRRRVRMGVEMAYSIDEMLKEEDVDEAQLLEDAHFVLKAMFHYPEYTAGPGSTTADEPPAS